MKIFTNFLMLAGLAAAASVQGNQDAPDSLELETTVVGTTESRELQTVIDGSSRGRGRGRGRSSGAALFIVEDDNDRSTTRCADDTADEFDGDFRGGVYIVSNDADARNGDVVAVIDGGTDCDRLWNDIEGELNDRHSTTTVYVYYGNGYRYYRNRAKRRSGGYRLYGRKYGRSRRWGGSWGKKRSRHHGHHKRSWGGGGKRSWGGGGGGKRSWGGGGHKRSWNGDKGSDKDHDRDHGGWKSGDKGSHEH